MHENIQEQFERKDNGRGAECLPHLIAKHTGNKCINNLVLAEK